MRNFYKQILGKLCRWMFLPQVRFRQAVVVEQVSRDARSLRLPVEPNTARAVMDMIMPVNNVYGSMHLNSADFRACKVLLVVYVVDVVVFYE